MKSNKIVKQGTHYDYQFMVVERKSEDTTHYCGYINIGSKHWLGDKYEDYSFAIVEITFADTEIMNSEGYWIGFFGNDLSDTFDFHNEDWAIDKCISIINSIIDRGTK